MLPRIYKSQTIAKAIVDDFENAPIPDLHKTMFRWAERFTPPSWELTAADLDALRADRLSGADIGDWAQVAVLQTWWVMQADGGEFRLNATPRSASLLATTTLDITAPKRRLPHQRPPSLPYAVAPAMTSAEKGPTSDSRPRPKPPPSVGFDPKLHRAVSLKPDILPRHQFALELLASPQTDALSPRQHALMRALTNAENNSSYRRETARQQFRAAGSDQALVDAVTGGFKSAD